MQWHHSGYEKKGGVGCCSFVRQNKETGWEGFAIPQLCLLGCQHVSVVMMPSSLALTFLCVFLGNLHSKCFISSIQRQVCCGFELVICFHAEQQVAKKVWFSV